MYPTRGLKGWSASNTIKQWSFDLSASAFPNMELNQYSWKDKGKKNTFRYRLLSLGSESNITACTIWKYKDQNIGSFVFYLVFNFVRKLRNIRYWEYVKTGWRGNHSHLTYKKEKDTADYTIRNFIIFTRYYLDVNIFLIKKPVSKK